GENDQLNLRQRRHQTRAPVAGTDRRRRAVGTVRVITGKTERHARQRDASLVVELVARHAHPLAQPIAAGVIERLARPMDANARSLARNEDLRRHGRVDHGTGLELCFADPASANFAEKSLEAFAHQSPRSRARAMTICWIWLVPS